MIEPQIVAHFMGNGVEAPITAIPARYKVGNEWLAVCVKPGVSVDRVVKGIGKEGIQWA